MGPHHLQDTGQILISSNCPSQIPRSSSQWVIGTCTHLIFLDLFTYLSQCLEFPTNAYSSYKTRKKYCSLLWSIASLSRWTFVLPPCGLHSVPSSIMSVALCTVLSSLPSYLPSQVSYSLSPGMCTLGSTSLWAYWGQQWLGKHWSWTQSKNSIYMFCRLTIL